MSAERPAIFPIHARLLTSRRPAHPNTTITRPFVSSRTVSSARSSAFGIRKIAEPGDVVIITGKGHERSMCFGTTEVPWSDQEAVAVALNQR